MRIRWKRWLVIIPASVILLIGGFWLGDKLWFYPSHADRVAIEGRYKQWHSALGEQRFGDAYKIMSPSYRAKHSAEDFGKQFDLWGDKRYSLSPTCTLRVHGSRGRLYPLEDPGGFELWSGPDFEWSKVDGEWYMTGEVSVFVD
jgi:hypothetical protein